MEIRDILLSEEVAEKVIDKHGLFPEEVEEAFFFRGARLKRGRNDRYLLYTRTREGAYILIVFTYEKGMAIIITARRMTEGERRHFTRQK